MKKVSVYCSGSIMKGVADEKKAYWTDVERRQVAMGAANHEVIFLNPDDPISDPANTLGQFGRDMYQVMVATAIIVDARERRGLGIGVEMAAAATFGTPVIVVAPRNSKYRSDELSYRGVTVFNYMHPHVAALANAVVDNFMDAGAALAELATVEVTRKHNWVWLDRAIHEYKENVLQGDSPMVEALKQLGLDG